MKKKCYKEKIISEPKTRGSYIKTKINVTCKNKWKVIWNNQDKSESIHSHECVWSHFSHVGLCVILWTISHQVPLSMGFSRQEHWSGLPFPPPGDLLTQGSNPGLLCCRKILYCLSHQGSLYHSHSQILSKKRTCMLSSFSHVQLSGTLWTIALQVPLSMEFSKQKYWSG